MAFRFPLATVLRFRASVERREDLALQKIILEMARMRRAIEHLTAEIAVQEEARIKAMLVSLPAFRLQTMLMEIEATADRRAALLESLAGLERQREIQTRAYQAAHRDRQMLSDMSTRQRDAYDQDRVRAEQKFLDDIFTARAQRG